MDKKDAYMDPRFRGNDRSGQAAAELAVFGAILIFLLGSIVRSAVGNSYTQDQNFQAMRMAMLNSWNGSLAGTTAHNSASVFLIEDRLTQDFNKYGDLDRNPYMAVGSGTFSYEMFYPLSGPSDYLNASPIADYYVNGQHFPFAEGAYVTKTLCQPGQCQDHPLPPKGALPVVTYPLTPTQCQQNREIRYARDWVGGGIVNENSFESVVPVSMNSAITASCIDPSQPAQSTLAERTCQQQYNSEEIFRELACKGWIVTQPAWIAADCFGTLNPATVTSPAQGSVSTAFTCTGSTCTMPAPFNMDFQADFGNTPTAGQLTSIENTLRQLSYAYKLFYTIQPNGGGNNFPNPPQPCTSSTCVNQVLTSTFTLPDALGNPYTNTNGDMAFDLLRDGYYTVAPSAPACTSPICQSVHTQFPPVQSCANLTGPGLMRCYIAWKWAATDGTSAANIGLVTTEGTFPQYDIDGRLKEVTIYTFSLNSNSTPRVGYLDPELGDIDSSWDVNSCGPKPGLQNTMQIFTFTQGGTYLLIKEGQLFNPQTGQVVRSANKRDNVDLIQRTVQLSNNTGRFCTTTSPPTWGTLGKPVSQGGTNPVEACVDESSAYNGCNCFMGGSGSNPTNATCGFTLAETCYDTSTNQIFIRSRIQDTRGRLWLTNASGQLGIK